MRRVALLFCTPFPFSFLARAFALAASNTGFQASGTSTSSRSPATPQIAAFVL